MAEIQICDFGLLPDIKIKSGKSDHGHLLRSARIVIFIFDGV
jgi:hypothetical protein